MYSKYRRLREKRKQYKGETPLPLIPDCQTPLASSKNKKIQREQHMRVPCLTRRAAVSHPPRSNLCAIPQRRDSIPLLGPSSYEA